MKLVIRSIAILISMQCAVYAMEAPQNSANPVSTQLSQLSIEQKQLVTKEDIQKNHYLFKIYVASIIIDLSPIVESKLLQKVATSDVAQKLKDSLAKSSAKSRIKKEVEQKKESARKKDESSKPDRANFLKKLREDATHSKLGLSELIKKIETESKPNERSLQDLIQGLEGVELKDTKFLFKFCDKKNMSSTEESVEKIGSDKQLKHLSNVIEKLKANPTETKKQSMAAIHIEVADFLGKKGTTKEALRKMIKDKNIIKDNDYFDATAMSIYAHFMIDNYSTEKNNK